jgi:STE24 endopeptidase
MTELLGLASCYLAYRLTAWGGLPGMLGIPHASVAAQLTILAFLGSIIAFPITPLSSWLSRRHELEADCFATDLTGTPEALASSLIKLSRENLSNLHPHPIYARFYYSHPPVVERVRRLMGMAEK